MITIELLPTLQVAAFALKAARDTLPALQSHHERCNRLIERCQRLIIDVCRQVNAGLTPQLKTLLGSVEEVCISVRDTIVKLSGQGAFRRLVSKEKINQEFVDAERALDNAFQRFNIGANVISNRQQQELAIALQKDRQQILRYLDSLLKRTEGLAESIERQESLPRPTGRHQPVVDFVGPAMVRPSWKLSRESIIVKSDKPSILGSGDFGKVHRGQLGDQIVIVKQIHEEVSHILLTSSRKMQTLEEKVLQWVALDHPHIRIFLGACFEAPKPLFVLSYCANGNVLEYIREYPEANRVSMLYQASIGMNYLHRNSIIHASLKHTNLLVSEDDKVLISDYDLSWLTADSKSSESTSIGSAQWTWTYMAPEYWEDDWEIHPSFDVYSFAMTAWVLHTGFTPFSRLAYTHFRKHVIERKERPPYPELMSKPLWRAMDGWWSHQAEHRPSFDDIEAFLSTQIDPKAHILPDHARQRRRKTSLQPNTTVRRPTAINQIHSTSSMSSTVSSPASRDHTIPISENGKNALAATSYALKKYHSLDDLVQSILLCYPNWFKNRDIGIRGPRPQKIYTDSAIEPVAKFKTTLHLWIQNIPAILNTDILNGARTLIFISAICLMAEYTYRQSHSAPYSCLDLFIESKLSISELRVLIEEGVQTIWSQYTRSPIKDHISAWQSIRYLVERGFYVVFNTN